MTIMQKCANFIFLGELCIKILSICIFGMGWGGVLGWVYSFFFYQTILNTKYKKFCKKKSVNKDEIKEP